MTVGIPTLPPSHDTTPTRHRRGLLAVALVVLVAAGAGAAWWQTTASSSPTGGESAVPQVAAVDDSSARAPQGVRIRVRVVNISGITGLARRTTQHLRAYGFDVIDFASAPTERGAATRIVVHTGHDEWGERVRKAMGKGTIRSLLDSSRYTDLTVFVGDDWRSPAKTLRP